MKVEEYMPKSIAFEYNDESIGQVININVKDEMYSGKHHCKILLNTVDLNSENLTDNKKVLDITYEEFDEIFNKVLCLNFNEMLTKSALIGLDGTLFKLTIGYAFNYLTFRVYMHDHDIINRGLENLNTIFNNLLKKLEINKFLLQNTSVEYDEEINKLTRGRIL